MVFAPSKCSVGLIKCILFLKSIIETHVVIMIFWFSHFKGALFSIFASKLLPCLIRENLKITFFQKVLVKIFWSYAHVDTWASQKPQVIVMSLNFFSNLSNGLG